MQLCQRELGSSTGRGNVEKGDEAQAVRQGEMCRGNRNGKKGCNKGITICFTRATPGTPASYKI